MFHVHVALALGGGAARGLAHLGAVVALREAGIPVHAVAGTSMGALVGAMFCRTGDASQLLDEALGYLRSPDFAEARIHRLHRETAGDGSMIDALGRYIARGRVIASTVARPSVLEAEDLYQLLGYFVDDRDIRSLKIPFRAVATDLVTGAERVIDKGPIIDAVAASSAVPGAFPPVRVDGRLCVDGGVLNMVPISAARGLGADYVIASNVSHELPVPQGAMRAIATHFRTHEITKRALTSLQLRFADAIVTPEVGSVHWADFTKSEEMIEAGRRAALAQVDAIREDLARLSWVPRAFRKPRVPPEPVRPDNPPPLAPMPDEPGDPSPEEPF